MKFWIVVVGCLITLYLLDSYLYHGEYFDALRQMFTRIAHHFQR